VALAEDHELLQALLADRSDESLRVSVAVRTQRGDSDYLDPAALEQLREARRVHRVAIQDQVRGSSEKPLFWIQQVSTHLLHPLARWVHHDPADLDRAALNLHDEEHEVPHRAGQADRLDGEEVARIQRFPMCLQEGLPRSGAAVAKSLGSAGVARRMRRAGVDDDGDEPEALAATCAHCGVVPSVWISGVLELDTWLAQGRPRLATALRPQRSAPAPSLLRYRLNCSRSD